MNLEYVVRKQSEIMSLSMRERDRETEGQRQRNQSELESNRGGNNWEDFWQERWNLQELRNTKLRPV